MTAIITSKEKQQRLESPCLGSRVLASSMRWKKIYHIQDGRGTWSGRRSQQRHQLVLFWWIWERNRDGSKLCRSGSCWRNIQAGGSLWRISQTVVAELRHDQNEESQILNDTKNRNDTETNHDTSFSIYNKWSIIELFERFINFFIALSQE